MVPAFDTNEARRHEACGLDFIADCLDPVDEGLPEFRAVARPPEQPMPRSAWLQRCVRGECRPHGAPERASPEPALDDPYHPVRCSLLCPCSVVTMNLASA